MRWELHPKVKNGTIFNEIVRQIGAAMEGLPDNRKASNDAKYKVRDAALSAVYPTRT